METIRNNDEHPSLLEIDLARTGEASIVTVEHLQSCAACKARLETLSGVAVELGTLTETAMPENSTHEREMLAFIVDRAAEIRQEAHRPRPLRIYRWIASVAAAVILAIGIRFWPTETDTRDDSPVGRGPIPISEYAANDLNKDGCTDAIDAYLLATQPDANPTDIESLMRQIVSINAEEDAK